MFERGDRFADEAVEDNREYIILPAVITKKPSIKIVDNWRQSSNSSSVTKIPALINSSGTLSYGINQSTLATKGGVLSHSAKSMGDEMRNEQSASIPVPAPFGQTSSFITPSRNARLNHHINNATSSVEQNEINKSARRSHHRQTRAFSLPEVPQNHSTPSTQLTVPTSDSILGTSLIPERRDLRRSLQNMLLPLAITAIVTDTPTSFSIPGTSEAASPIHFVKNPVGTLLTTTPRSSSKDKLSSIYLQSRTSSTTSLNSEDMLSTRPSLNDDPMTLLAKPEDILPVAALGTVSLAGTMFQPQPPSVDKKHRRSNSFRHMLLVEHPSAPDTAHATGEEIIAVPHLSAPPCTPLGPLSRNNSSNFLSSIDD